MYKGKNMNTDFMVVQEGIAEEKRRIEMLMTNFKDMQIGDVVDAIAVDYDPSRDMDDFVPGYVVEASIRTFAIKHGFRILTKREVGQFMMLMRFKSVVRKHKGKQCRCWAPLKYRAISSQEVANGG